jgi:probable F420-dependent oxidoreductase
VKIGFTLPQVGAVAWQAPRIARYAREVEMLGADSLWVVDRLLSPVQPEVGYNGAETFPDQFHAILDPFSLMAVAASATQRAVIGTNILNAPMYSPTLLSRTLTTLDLVSEGRLVLGLGAGWSPDEFQAVGISMEDRGARFDEILDVLERLWTEDPVEFEGDYWRIPATYATLKPARRPPVYLAGFAPAAMRRVARRADGWLPALAPPRFTDLDMAVNQPMTVIRELAAEAGRDPDALDMILRIYPTERSETIVADVTDMIKRVGDQTAVRHVLVDLMYQADDIDQLLELVAGILRAAA